MNTTTSNISAPSREGTPSLMRTAPRSALDSSTPPSNNLSTEHFPIQSPTSSHGLRPEMAGTVGLLLPQLYAEMNDTHEPKSPPVFQSLNGKMADSPSPSKSPLVQASDYEGELLFIGERVVASGTMNGILRYWGPVQFSSGCWAGIELDEPGKFIP